ncbi:MAG: hypothetical protein ACOYJB_07800 [Christensenellaceae bacterium]
MKKSTYKISRKFVAILVVLVLTLVPMASLVEAGPEGVCAHRA